MSTRPLRSASPHNSGGSPTPDGTSTPPQGSGGPRQIPLTCAGHTRPVVQLQFSRILDDGNYLLISACKDGNPMLRIGDTGDWIGTFKGHKGAVWCARLNEEASRAVTASADFSVNVWDTYSGSVLYSFPHKHIVRSVDISPDGRWVVSGGHEKKIRVYDLEAVAAATAASTPIPPPVEVKGHEATIRAVMWDPWRSVVLSAADEKDIKVWQGTSLDLVHTMETLDPVSSLSLSDDGEVIQAAAGKSVYFWSAQTYELACRIDTPHDLSCVALHPMRDRFVVGSRTDTWVRVYHFPTGEELEVYKGHHGPVHTVAYSPDGALYASGSEDGTIRLWQTVPGMEYGLWQTQEELQQAAAAAAAAATGSASPTGHMTPPLTGATGLLPAEEEAELRKMAEEEARALAREVREVREATRASSPILSSSPGANGGGGGTFQVNRSSPSSLSTASGNPLTASNNRRYQPPGATSSGSPSPTITPPSSSQPRYGSGRGVDADRW